MKEGVIMVQKICLAVSVVCFSVIGLYYVVYGCVYIKEKYDSLEEQEEVFPVWFYHFKN